MAANHFVPMWRKEADNGSELKLCRGGHHAWFIERPADREAGANPLGAFRSLEAAKKWADHSFPGGEWVELT